MGTPAWSAVALLVWVGAPSCASDLSNPPPDDVPTAPGALHAWLLADGHGTWPAESAVHPTEQGGGARVYLNDALLASLEAGNEAHPVGSAAVRELYESDLTTQRGFGALVKTEDQGADGNAWFFYETFQMTPRAPHSIAQQGAPGCVGCHQEGIDYVRSKLPLP